MSSSGGGYSSAPNSGNSVEFDISEKFRQRLRETQVQKENLLLKISAGVDHLKLLIAKLPRKSRDSVASLDAKIQSLEHERTRRSLKLSEEKAILRQIKGIERAKTLLAEFQEQESLIKEKKIEVSALRETLRTTIAQIAELETAISKVELAKRLGCSTADLRTHVTECPTEKLGMLIGKNGSNIKAIEKNAGVQIDVDKVGKKIHIIGNQESIVGALELVEDITLAVSENISLSSDIVTYIQAKWAKTMEMLVEKHRDVYFDFNKEDNVMVVRGRPINVALAKSDVLNISVKKETISIKGNQVGIILGKNGSTINKFVKKYDVAIELDDESGNDLRVVEILGENENVQQALTEVKELLYQNEELEVIIVTNQMIRNKLLADSAVLIKKIQNEVQAEVGGTANVSVMYQKLAKGERMTNASSNLFVKAARHSISKAQELVQDYINKYQGTITELMISTDIIQYVIGKGGKIVSNMRKNHSGADIEIDRTTGKVQIMTENEETRNKLIQEIDQIVLQNQVTSVAVEKNMMGAIFGTSGKEMRAKILNELDVNITTPSSDDQIILRGTTEKIKEASEILEDFIASNYTSEFSILVEDEKFLVQDGDEIKKIEKEHNTKITILKGRRIVIICGRKENVDESEVGLKRIVFGSKDDDYIVSKLRVPSAALGVIIGKGGSNLSKLEQRHVNVSIYLHKDNSLLCLRGAKVSVEKCCAEIINTMYSTFIYDSILITNEDYESFTQDSILTKMLDNIPVQVSLNESSIRLRGLSLDVRDAKSLVIEHMTGQYESSFEFEPIQMEIIQKFIKKDDSHFDRIRIRSKAEIKANYVSSSIKFSGKRSCVKKAKSYILGFLGTILPSQFSKFKVAKPLLKSIGDPSVLGKISSDTGATISIDRDLNSIIVQSSNPERVKDAIILLEMRKAECTKLNTVIQFDQSDSWLLPKLIEKRDAMIEQVEKDNDCSINVYKDELIIIISGKIEANVSLAASSIEKMIEKERKECIFIDLVESSMSSFIGKGGSHIKKLEEDYCVRIERMRKDPFRLQIEGDETNVESAKCTIVNWLDDWTQKNEGLSCKLEENVVPFVLEKDTEVKKNEKASIVTSSLKTDSLNDKCNGVPVTHNLDDIPSGTMNGKSLKTSLPPTPSTSANYNSTAKKLYSLLENKPMANASYQGGKLLDIPSKEPASLNVEKTSSDTLIGNRNNTFPKTSTSGYTGGAAKDLYSLLVSTSNGGKMLPEQWDSSTMSSGIASSSMEDESFGEQPTATFKSMSGYSVRL